MAVRQSTEVRVQPIPATMLCVHRLVTSISPWKQRRHFFVVPSTPACPLLLLLSGNRYGRGCKLQGIEYQNSAAETCRSPVYPSGLAHVASLFALPSGRETQRASASRSCTWSHFDQNGQTGGHQGRPRTVGRSDQMNCAGMKLGVGIRLFAVLGFDAWSRSPGSVPVICSLNHQQISGTLR